MAAAAPQARIREVLAVIMGAGRASNLSRVTGPVDSIDLGGMRLTSGEGRRLDVEVRIEPFELGANTYLRLRFDASLVGSCMRCLEPARAPFSVDAREISQPGAGDELDSPYLETQMLDLSAWARDALALMLPRAILCRPDCSGLCPACGANLNDDLDHHHEVAPDSRWAKLSEIRFDA
jgi:uncharacterized protein